MAATLYLWNGAADEGLGAVVPKSAHVQALVFQRASGQTGLDSDPLGDALLGALGDKLVLLRTATGAGEALSPGKRIATVRPAVIPRAFVFVTPNQGLDAALADTQAFVRAKAQVALARRMNRERPEPIAPALAGLLDPQNPTMAALEHALQIADALLSIRFGGEWNLYAHILSNRYDWLDTRAKPISDLGIAVRRVHSARELPAW